MPAERSTHSVGQVSCGQTTPIRFSGGSCEWVWPCQSSLIGNHVQPHIPIRIRDIGRNLVLQTKNNAGYHCYVTIRKSACKFKYEFGDLPRDQGEKETAEGQVTMLYNSMLNDEMAAHYTSAFSAHPLPIDWSGPVKVRKYTCCFLSTLELRSYQSFQS